MASNIRSFSSSVNNYTVLRRFKQGAYGLGLDVLNRGGGVHLVTEHVVELLEEGGVVNHAGAVGDAVAVEQRLDLGLGQRDVERANAGAEL